MAAPFETSEAYKFNLGQGVNALDRSAVAGGRSRNADTMKYAQGMASNEYGNYMNRIQNLASVNTGYANSLATGGTNYANQVGQNNQYAGNAQAQGALANGQSQAQMYNSMGNMPMNAMAMYNMYNQPQQQQQAPQYTGPPQSYNETYSPRY